MAQSKRGMLFEAVSVLLLIFLSFLMLMMVTTGNPLAEWSMSDVIVPPLVTDTPSTMTRTNMFVGQDGTLYTIDGHNIHAISGSGAVLWNVTIPDKNSVRMHGSPYSLSAYGSKWNGLYMAQADGVIVFTVVPEDTFGMYVQGALLAVSTDGHLLWTKPFSSMGDAPFNSSSGYILGSPGDLIARNGQLYVYSWSYENVLSLNGTIMWYVSGPYDMQYFSKPDVDDAGDLYVMQVGFGIVGRYPGNERENATIDDELNKKFSNRVSLADGTIMGGNYDTVQAYYANGTPKWSVNITKLGIDDPFVTPYYVSMEKQPVYHNGTLYVWLPHTLLALDMDGRLKWHKQYDGYFFDRVWFDSRDNVYIEFLQDMPSPVTRIMIVAPDGNETMISPIAASSVTGLTTYPAFYGNISYRSEWVTPLYDKVDLNLSNATYPDYNISIAYQWFRQHDAILQYLRDHNGSWDFPRRLHDLDTYTIGAYDFKTGRQLWNYTIPLQEKEATLTNSSVAGLLLNPGDAYADNNVSERQWYAANAIPYGSEGVGSMSRVNILPSVNTTYVSFWSYCYEVPAIYDRSRIVYSGGIYALDRNGSLLWKKDLDSPVSSMKEVNGTIYYSTNSGRLSATKAEAFVGFLAAFLYLFIRFFLAGAVTRARGLVNKNDNRNSILKFIEGHPGAGLYEISRHLKINKGTAGYHLLILGLNHRIVSYRGDNRYVRYFTNSGTYSEEEQLAMSLARRDGVRKVLAVIAKKPGLSTVDISREAGIHASAASRNLKELVEKGIVSREISEGGRVSYSIVPKYQDLIVSAVERLTLPVYA